MNETCMPAKRHSWLSGEQLLRPSPLERLTGGIQVRLACYLAYCGQTFEAEPRTSEMLCDVLLQIRRHFNSHQQGLMQAA